MNYKWIYIFIVFSGVLQACGAPMNGELNNSMRNPWLASVVSFGLVTLFFIGAFVIWPHPLPSTKELAAMPWWAPIGGLVGAVAVYAGLTLVTKIGAGPYTGLTVTASLITSIAIDNFGLFRMPVHSINIWRILGGVLMVCGVALISLF